MTGTRLRRGLLTLLVLTLAANAAVAQETYKDRGNQLLSLSKVTEAEAVFAEWVRAEPRNADAHYYLAVSWALEGRTEDARKGFRHVLDLDPRRADARFELAASYLGTRDYSLAADWATEGLRDAPDDEYGLDLMGTICFVNGTRLEALRYWNRLGRPHLTGMDIRTTGGVTRQTVASTINLAPGDLLSLREIEKSRWWLNQYRFIRSVRFDPVPGATADQYSLDVVVDSRRGVGSFGELAFGSLAEIWFRTVRFNYWNIAGTGMTLAAKWRFKKAAERFGVDLDLPRPAHLPVIFTVGYAHRHERWQPAAQSNGFVFRINDATVGLTIPIRLPSFSVSASVTGRERVYETLWNTDPAVAAADSQYVDRRADQSAADAMWIRVVPRIVWSVDRFLEGWDLRSNVRAGIEVGRTRGTAPTDLSRVWLSAEGRLERARRGRLEQRISVGFHAGRLSTSGLVEDRFILGVGPDADFPLRGHLYLRNGQPGAAPLTSEFVLGNFSAVTDLLTIDWFKLGVVLFADVARVARLYPGQTMPTRLFDAGVGLELGSAFSSSQRFTLSWGKDWRTNRSVFYITTTIR